MILVVLLILAAAASAQTNDHARALLEEIASSARATQSWRAEGVEVGEVTFSGVQQRQETHFKLAVQGPTKMRWETSGDDAGLVVCDGTDHWTYHSPGVSFYRNPVTVSPCLPPHDFSKLADNLVAAALIGRDRVPFAGGLRECELVRAEYAVPVPPNGGAGVPASARILCIDPRQRLVLRDRTESGAGASDVHLITTITYTSYEHDVKLSPDVFEFLAPTGTFEDDGPLISENPVAEGGVYRIGAGVSGPTIASKVEPSYTEEARRARVAGIVSVSLTVDSVGKPQNMKVVRGLGHGLDEKAVEAVGQWRFHPGMKDGAPVAVGTLRVIVNFRLP